MLRKPVARVGESVILGMNRTVVIIPARGGSKGIPRKNIVPLCGKPLIQYSIEAALAAKCSDRVYVSTDDIEIAQVALLSGARVLSRPLVLGEDEVQLSEVLVYCLRQLNHEENYHPDTVIMLQPTSPLRTGEHIDLAYRLYRGDGTVFSAFEDTKFHWTGNDGAQPIHHDPQKRLGRQWIASGDHIYTENGAIYIFPAHRLSLELTFRLYPFTIYVMPEEDGYEIDTPLDLEWCEHYLSKNGLHHPSLIPGG